MIELVLVRHAQPDWEPAGLAVDAPGLTELGRAQAARVAAELSGFHFDGFHVSPLRRAEETASSIADALGVQPIREGWLAELGVPKLEGTPTDEVARFFEAARLREVVRWWDGLPGGESFRLFHERVTAGIEKLLFGAHGAEADSEPGHGIWRIPDGRKKLLVVAHGGTNAVILSHLLGVESVPWAFERFTMGWAGLSRLATVPVAHGAVWSLQTHNSRSHLSGLPDPAG